MRRLLVPLVVLALLLLPSGSTAKHHHGGTDDGSTTPKMERVWFEAFTYDGKTPIPCGSETTVGRVVLLGFVEMNEGAFWNVRVDYGDLEQAHGAAWYQITNRVWSPTGVSEVTKDAQQINSFGDHVFQISHVGDANHQHTCTITRVKQ